MKGLLGKNLGMTQTFGKDGESIPVTVLKCGPCVVVQKKTKENEGYNALQLGFEEVKKVQRVSRPLKGHFQKAKTGVFRHLAECRIDAPQDIALGDVIGVEVFEVGDKVNIRSQTKGRGYQGVIKRHGKHGGPGAHGSHFHRAPGSIGMRTWPGRVIKNMKLPGHMGTDFVTVRNLQLVDIDRDNHLLFVKGSIPGYKSGLVRISHSRVDLASRLAKKKGGT